MTLFNISVTISKGDNYIEIKAFQRTHVSFNPLLHMAFHRSSALQSSDEQFHQSRKLKELY